MWNMRSSGGNRTSLVAMSLLAALWLLSVTGNLSALAAVPITVGGHATVTNTDGDPIRVRQDAGTGSPIVCVAREGDTALVLDGPRIDKSSNRWFKVQVTGGTGWMSAEFLKAAAAPKLTGAAVVANTDGDPLRLRATPSAGGKVLALLDPGTAVAVQTGPLTDDMGIAWYQITARGLNGWAMAQYLAQAPAAQSLERNTPPQATQAVAKKAAPAPSPPPVPSAKPKQTPIATPRPPVPAAPAAPSGGMSTLAQYRQWVEEARQMYPYPQSTDKMWRVMMCESGGNPSASGGGSYIGLFQYAPSTWAGGWNPYRGSSIRDAHAQIFATAKAWSIGMQGAWSCYYMV